MPETAILNEVIAWDEEIDDSIGPDYGWERLRRSQLAIAKPAFGRPWTRTVGVAGHSTQFSWLKRSRACVERLKKWAEQYEEGFFTIIDHDGGERHYVGNFVGDMPLTQAGNDLYNIQGWTFEEIPGCPMAAYPEEWDLWAVSRSAVDDYGDQKIATFTAAGTWAQPAAVADDAGILRQPLQMQLADSTIGDFAQYEYIGYGCRLWLCKSAIAGIVQVLVDGVLVADNLVLTTDNDLGPQMVYEAVAMPLGLHRIKVIVLALVPGAPDSKGFTWDRVEVMR